MGMPIQSLPGLILAGGQSRRMGGGAKGERLLAGCSLAQRVVTRLLPQVDRVVVSTNGDPAQWQALGLTVIRDCRPNFPGPLAGVEAGLLALDHPWLLTVAVDLPWFPLDLAARMGGAAQVAGLPVVASSLGRIHPTVVLWPRSALPDIGAALDRQALRLTDWFANNPHGQVDFGPDAHGEDPFFNINRPEDLARAEAILAVREGR